MVSPGGVPVPSGSLTDSFFDAGLQLDSPVHQTLEIMYPHLSCGAETEQKMSQFKFQKMMDFLVDLPEGKYAIGTKWILKNKRDARGIVVRNKARLVAQGHRQEEGIDYDEVFIDITKEYTIDKTLFLKKHKRDIILVQVYVDDIIFGSTKKVWCDEFEALMKGEFEMSAMGELIFFLGLQVQQRPDGIFIGQDKYVQEILKKFDLESGRDWQLDPMSSTA
ncbi:retrovirus-related pol polyprotein from transposon TNT 1-94 [Tanacetum coccineum]